MPLTRRALAALPLLAGPALAQSPWPDRPIRLIVPFGPGGAIDTLSRNVASRFAEHANGQSLVVENRPGAGGTIAGAFVAQQRPDGLTLMMSDLGANAIGRLLYPALPYDPLTAFTPVIHLVSLPGALIAHPDVPHRTPAEIIAAARARPDGFTYSSAGSGNASHLFMGKRALTAAVVGCCRGQVVSGRRFHGASSAMRLIGWAAMRSRRARR